MSCSSRRLPDLAFDPDGTGLQLRAASIAVGDGTSLRADGASVESSLDQNAALSRDPLYSDLRWVLAVRFSYPRINEAFAQGIFDLRIFMDHLEHDLGVPRMGVTGVSLGGFTAGAALRVRPPQLPVTSIADLVLGWQPIGSFVKLALSATGKDVHDARHLLSVSCPLSYPPRIARERLMIIGGVGDAHCDHRG